MQAKLEELITQKNLGDALGISKATLYGLRRKGCPWVSLGNKIYFHEPIFMEWILLNCSRASDPEQAITRKEKTATEPQPTDSEMEHDFDTDIK